MSPHRSFIVPLVIASIAILGCEAFSPRPSLLVARTGSTFHPFELQATAGGGKKSKESTNQESSRIGTNKLSAARKKQLGVAEDEDEYDLSMALNNNTDSFITKAIAGSLIVVMIALLVVGVVIPATTDYGEGVCNPILTAGRC